MPIAQGQSRSDLQNLPVRTVSNRLKLLLFLMTMGLFMGWTRFGGAERQGDLPTEETPLEDFLDVKTVYVPIPFQYDSYWTLDGEVRVMRAMTATALHSPGTKFRPMTLGQFMRVASKERSIEGIELGVGSYRLRKRSFGKLAALLKKSGRVDEDLPPADYEVVQTDAETASKDSTIFSPEALESSYSDR